MKIMTLSLRQFLLVLTGFYFINIFYNLNMNTFFLIGLRFVHLKDIQTYFLNKNYDFKNPLCQTCSDIECLFTEGNYNFPEETTICVRWGRRGLADNSREDIFSFSRAKPKSNVDAKEDWSSVFGFGNMAREKAILDEVNNVS